MRTNHRLPALLFAFLLCAAAAPPVLRAWNIRLLYLDASVRDEAEVGLRQISTLKGWLLSDVELTEVSREGMAFLHREHRRTPAPPACFTLTFATSELHPCAA